MKTIISVFYRTRAWRGSSHFFKQNRFFCDGFVSFDFYNILFYILSKSQKGTEPFLHIRSVVLVLFSYGRYCVF